VKAGSAFTVLQKNSVGEPVVASLELAGDSIYIRSDTPLFQIRGSASLRR